MAKDYIQLSFEEYPPEEILGSEMYMKSIKSLSFQYRAKKGNELIAYIALAKEQPMIMIPNVDDQSKGCRILGIYVKPILNNGYAIDMAALRVAMLDEAEFYINGWVNLQTNKFEFDYLWCYNEDVEKQEIIDEIGGMTTIGGISYRPLSRV